MLLSLVMVSLSEMKSLSNLMNIGLRRHDLGNLAWRERSRTSLRRGLSLVNRIENSRNSLIILNASSRRLMKRDVEQVDWDRQVNPAHENGLQGASRLERTLLRPSPSECSE